MTQIRQLILKYNLIYLVIGLLIHQLSAICIKNENNIKYQNTSGITLISLFNSFDIESHSDSDIDKDGDGAMQGQSEVEDEIPHFENDDEDQSPKFVSTFRDATLIYHVDIIAQHFFETHSPPPELA